MGKPYYGVALALILFALAGCSGDQGPLFVLPEGTSQETRDLVALAMPTIEEHCPGLRTYKESLPILRVSPHNMYMPGPEAGLPKDVFVTWIIFKVPDDGGNIPPKYRAWRHHLRLGIEETGKAIILKKRTTMKVFLDRADIESGRDMYFAIRPEK